MDDTRLLAYESTISYSYRRESQDGVLCELVIDIYKPIASGRLIDYLGSIISNSPLKDEDIVEQSKLLCLPDAEFTLFLPTLDPELFKRAPFGIFFLVESFDTTFFLVVGKTQSELQAIDYGLRDERVWIPDGKTRIAVRRRKFD